MNKRTGKAHMVTERLYMLVVLLQFLSLAAFAQTAVTGTVKDPSGNTLTGATVSLKGKPVATATDANGNFSIKLPGSGEVLVFSMVGFKKTEVPAAGKSTFNIVLEESAEALGEIVVTGYGRQSRELITTAVSKLDTKALENIPYANVLSSLQGSIPGLRVQSFTGQPGQAPRVILRGGTSISNPNGSEPLYVVDGVIRPNMNDIAADDIESVQVLKDAAATAIYGARASNGVILATTRSGKPGKLRVTYAYDITVADKGNTMLDYATARQYIEYGRLSVLWAGVKLPAATTTSRLNAASGFGTGNDLTNKTAYTTMYLTPENQHKLNEGWESMPDPVDPTKTIIFKGTDFQDLTYQTAVSHNHYLSASGGTEKATFFLSGGYLAGEGTALASDYKRLTFNVNGNLQVTSNFNVGARVMYANVSDHAITGDPLTMFTPNAYTFYRSASIPATTKYRFEDGSMAPGQNSGAGNPHYYQIGPYAPQRKNIRNTLSLALSGRWEILPGLTFDPQVSMFEISSNNRSFQPAYLSSVLTMNTTRTAAASSSSTKNYQADAVLTYAKLFSNAHNLEAKVGFSYYDRQSNLLNATGNGAATDLVPTLNGSSVPIAVGGTESKFVTEGLFSRINYDYNGKYLLSLTARYDGASNLGSANRFGFFPGVGIGWNLHKENFWKAIPTTVSSLKLRGSYGENGNIQGLGDFSAQGLYGIDGIYSGGGAVQPSVLPNPNLRWEESRTLNAGFDLGLFSDRVSVIFEYFRRVTDNLLINVTLPPSSGYENVLTNFGSLENKGFEAGLAAQVLPSASAFQWNVNLSVSNVNNKVLRLPNNGIEKNRQGGVYVWDPAIKNYAWKAGFAGGAVGAPTSFMEGSRVGDMYAYQQIGIYATDEEAAGAPEDISVPVDQVNPANGRKKYGGDVKWADLDGNNIIDSKDQVYVGNMLPTWTGGFTNTFSYKNLSLNIRTDFALGHTIYNYARVVADGQLQGDLMPSREFIEKSWKKQGDITNTPRFLWQNSQGNITRNATYYEKGDYLAIREVSLSYNLPEHLLRKIRLSNCRVNLTGSNLHYFTKYKGLNPEDGGPDNGRYPNPRGISLGVNVTL